MIHTLNDTLPETPAPWVVIAGGNQDGRDDALGRVVERWRQRGWRVGGFGQERLEENGEVVGYDLTNLTTGRRIPLARVSERPTLCNLAFDPAAFNQGRSWIEEEDADVVVVQVGKLEAAGEGHWPAVASAFGRARLVLLVVRKHLLARVLLQLPDPVAGTELPATPAELDSFADLREVLAAVANDRGERA